MSPTFRFLPELRPMEQAMVNWLEQLRRSASICQQTAASHDGAAHRMIESMMLREEKRLRGLHQKARLTNGALSSERQAVQLLRARERIETGYHEPLSLDDLAAVACLSRFHFLRLFAERFGTTPAQYMALKRLKSALRLMANADLSIDEIARQVGYRSRTTLYRQIVSKLGQPPARVRADAGRHLRTLIAK